MQLVQLTLDDLNRVLFRLGRNYRFPIEEGGGQYGYISEVRRA